jgi:hypothetical protein
MTTEAEVRQYLIELYRESDNENFLRAALCLQKADNLLDEADSSELLKKKRGRGRPPTVGLGLNTRLVRMALMIVRGEVDSPHAAAQIEADRPHAHLSRQAAVEYLRKAYIKDRRGLEDWARWFILTEEQRLEIEKSAERRIEAWTKIARI